MQTIKLRSHVGEDGILHLDVPVALKETDLEITMTVEPIPKKLTHEEARKMFEESRKQYQGCIFSNSEAEIGEPRYNAWGQLVKQELILEAIEGMKQLRKTVALDNSEIREMREEGRRF